LVTPAVATAKSAHLEIEQDAPTAAGHVGHAAPIATLDPRGPGTAARTASSVSPGAQSEGHRVIVDIGRLEPQAGEMRKDSELVHGRILQIGVRLRTIQIHQFIRQRE
jgi:hypothetical protein